MKTIIILLVVAAIMFFIVGCGPGQPFEIEGVNKYASIRISSTYCGGQINVIN